MIDDVPASKVRFVVVFRSHCPQVIVDAPSVSVRVAEPVNEKWAESVSVCPFVSRVPVNAPPVIDATPTPAVTVTVPPPELPSKITASEPPGTDAPPDPPELVLQ